MVQLYYGTNMYYNPLHLLEDNNRTEPLQKDDMGSGWFTGEETSFMNASITLLIIDELTYILKSMNLELLLYLSLKLPL